MKNNVAFEVLEVHVNEESEVLGVIFIINLHHQALSIKWQRELLCRATISAHTCIENVRINMLMQLNYLIIKQKTFNE